MICACDVAKILFPFDKSLVHLVPLRTLTMWQ